MECDTPIEDGIPLRCRLEDQRRTLKIQPRAKQHIARWQSRRRLPKSSILQIGIHAVEIHAIEYVEEVDTKFKVDALANLRDLLKGKVRIRVARIPELVGSLIPLLAEGG